MKKSWIGATILVEDDEISALDEGDDFEVEDKSDNSGEGDESERSIKHEYATIMPETNSFGDTFWVGDYGMSVLDSSQEPEAASATASHDLMDQLDGLMNELQTKAPSSRAKTPRSFSKGDFDNLYHPDDESVLGIDNMLPSVLLQG